MLFAGDKGDEIWLFVSIPVFDTPSNNKGWIKESDTVKYTREILDKVDVGIIVRKGTVGYYIKDGNAGIIAEKDRIGSISQRESGRVYVFFAGGDALWYEEEDIAYPEPSREN